MGTVNAINPNIDLSARIFNDFDAYSPSIDSDDYDVVSSFFLSIFKNPEAAQNLTDTFFQIAQQTNTPVLTLLDQVAGQDAIKLTATMAYYLNGLRSPSTLLGINAPVLPNFYTARNVLP
jgi:pyruvate/2-oxoacid:ferredoxin oxidoreductase alpha subunit